MVQGYKNYFVSLHHYLLLYVLIQTTRRNILWSTRNIKNNNNKKMEQVFSYIISLGASVMMPIIFTVIGLLV